jgi:hypothetical protein
MALKSSTFPYEVKQRIKSSFFIRASIKSSNPRYTKAPTVRYMIGARATSMARGSRGFLPFSKIPSKKPLPMLSKPSPKAKAGYKRSSQAKPLPRGLEL